MLQILKRYHKLIIVIMVVVAMIFYFQYVYSSNLLQQLNEEKAESSMEQIHTEFSWWMTDKKNIVKNSATFIGIVDNQQRILSYLEDTLAEHSELNALYYLSADNQMINASGFVPPADMDARERPWYRMAMEKQNLIITDAFLNVTEDDLIISIAMPVYNQQEQITGVVSADLSLLLISDMLATNTNISGSKSFLLDQNDFLIASSDPGISEAPYENQNMDTFSFEKMIIAGESGYLSSLPLNDQGWTLLFFVPSDYLLEPSNTLRAFMLASLLVFLITLLTFMFLQRKMITEPLIAMEKEKNEEIKIEKINFEALFKNSTDAIAIVDIQNRIMDINEKFTKLFQYTLEETKGIDIDTLIVTEEKINEAKSFTEDLFQEKVDSVETVRFDKFGNPKEVELKGVPIVLNGKIVGGYASYTDISQRKAAERETLYISYHDQLTGVYNRRYFENKLKEIDTPENLPLTIVMADLNGLKLANDAFGHALGDKLLVKTAEIIKDHLGEKDFVARTGGDEFIIVMPESDEEVGRDFINRVSQVIYDTYINSIDMSVSFGWDTKHTKEESIHDTLNKAENYMYKRKLSEGPSMVSSTIKIIINTLHEKNERERQHSERVSKICMDIGEAMGFDKEQLSVLNLVGLMHDIGKIGIDENILNKEGKLTKEEYEEIKKHPEIGYRILSSTNEMSDLAIFTLSHHERWDGTGYPKGIKGLDIPLVSRILAIADAFDAMTSGRPYRDPQTVEFAVSELKKGSGTQFDPTIVEIFTEKVLQKYI